MKYTSFKNKLYRIEFRVSIIDYQFPDIESGYDGNWLNVKYECFYNLSQQCLQHQLAETFVVPRVDATSRPRADVIRALHHVGASIAKQRVGQRSATVHVGVGNRVLQHHGE